MRRLAKASLINFTESQLRWSCNYSLSRAMAPKQKKKLTWKCDLCNEIHIKTHTYCGKCNRGKEDIQKEQGAKKQAEMKAERKAADAKAKAAKNGANKQTVAASPAPPVDAAKLVVEASPSNGESPEMQSLKSEETYLKSIIDSLNGIEDV